jgi:hypothetical protein
VEKRPHKDKGLPPFIHRWRQFYFLVLGWVALLILLFYAFKTYFE